MAELTNKVDRALYRDNILESKDDFAIKQARRHIKMENQQEYDAYGQPIIRRQPVDPRFVQVQPRPIPGPSVDQRPQQPVYPQQRPVYQQMPQNQPYYEPQPQYQRVPQQYYEQGPPQQQQFQPQQAPHQSPWVQYPPVQPLGPSRELPSAQPAQAVPKKKKKGLLTFLIVFSIIIFLAFIGSLVVFFTKFG